MNEINFTKLTGAGNDFVLIDKKLNPKTSITSELIKRICDRRYGVGADGLLTIDDGDNIDFKMEYFNSDGSGGMLCGNGARCVIKYADYSKRISGVDTKFTFNGEDFSGALIDDNSIRFNLNSPTTIEQNIKIEALNKKLNLSFVDIGASHAVVNIDDSANSLGDIELFPMEEYAKAIRYSKHFEPLGTNVNFISIKNNIINIRTYEKGIEEETFACGTGSVASAIISFMEGKISTPVKLKTKRGNILEVDFQKNRNRIENVTLTGPAKIVFQGIYKIDNEEN
ncbi:MAG: diaminopimelate epimerase [Melioribacteraceae bacterium]|nr:diaminopimelate epimerase [Melioribacteraceae bacterium]